MVFNYRESRHYNKPHKQKHNRQYALTKTRTLEKAYLGVPRRPWQDRPGPVLRQEKFVRRDPMSPFGSAINLLVFFFCAQTLSGLAQLTGLWALGAASVCGFGVSSPWPDVLRGGFTEGYLGI